MNKILHPLTRKLTSAFAAALCCALVAPNSKAGLADFEAIQSSNSGLLFQYRFEGSSDVSRLADWGTNGYTLQRVVGTGGGNVTNIQFLPGFDGVSQAYQPSFSLTGATIGAGLNTISTVPYGTNVTVEAIVQMDDYTEPTGNSGGVYILSARNAANTAHRAYFLKQRPANEVATTLGDNNSDSLAFVSPYTAGNWYYVAMTAEYDSVGNVTTVNLYRANLSAAQATIEYVLTDSTTFTGQWAGTSQFGVGAFIGGNTQFMQGRIDNVAVTTGVLSSGDLQTRLDALYVAAPGCSGPTIVRQPANQSIGFGSPASFTVLALGTSPTYQWQVSTNSGSLWDNVSTGTGGTTAGYTTPANTTADSGKQYRCIINVACNSQSVTSSVASLNVVLSLATWTGTAGDQNWNTASNWNIFSVPSGTIAALIPASSNVNFTTPAPSFGGLTNSGVLNVNTNGFTNSGIVMSAPATMLINPGAAMIVNGSFGMCSNAFTTVSSNSSLIISGSLNVGSNPTGGSSSPTTGAFARMTNNGGTITATATTMNSGNATVTGNPLFVINGGINNLGDVDIGRPSGSSQVTLGQEGLMIYGGRVNMTSLRLGNNNWASMLVSPGSVVTNSGTGLIRNATANRPARLLQTGGSYVTLGIQTMTVSTGTGNGTTFSITGGTNLLGGLRFGDTNTNPGTANFTNSANLYIGSFGISNSGSAVVNARLNPGGLIGATADWSGYSPMVLGAGNFTFKAADLSGTPRNIYLAGALSGTGPLSKTGGGTLTMDTAHTYSASTFIDEGTLAIGPSGSLASTEVRLASNTVFNVSSVPGYTLAAGRTLSGFGVVTGDVAVSSTAILSPGTNLTTGTLAFSNSITQTGGARNIFKLSSAPAGPNNDLIIVGGDLNCSGINDLEVSGGGPVGSVHPLFKYGGTFNGDVNDFNLVGVNGVITNITSTKTIALRITVTVRPPTNVVWVGNPFLNDWDTLNVTNWTTNANLTYFVTGDNALFNAVGAANPDVNIVGTVSPGSVTVNAATDYTFNGTGIISGSGALTKTNSGKLTINNVNGFTGGLNLFGGTVSVSSLADAGNDSSIGKSGTVLINGGVLEYLGSSVTWNRALSFGDAGGTIFVSGSGDLRPSGVLSGNGKLIKIGAGQLDLRSPNTYAGGTEVLAGTLRIDRDSGATAGTNIMKLAGGAESATLQFGGDTQVLPNVLNITNSNNFVSASGNNTVNNIIGNGTLTVNGGNTFTVQGDMTQFSGTLVAGTLPNLRFHPSIGSSNALFDLGSGSCILNNRESASGGVTIHLGALQGGFSTSVRGAINDDGDNKPSTYSIGGRNLDTTFDGVFSEYSPLRKVNVLKVGTGRLTLTGASTYTGTTTVSNGILQIDGSLGTNTVAIDGGTLSGIGTIGGTVTVNAGGNLAPGASIGTLTINGDLNLGGTLTVEVNTTNAQTADLVTGVITNTFGGTLAIVNLGPTPTVSDTFQLFSAGTYQGTFANINPPSAGPGLIWDTSTLATDGILRVAVGSVAPTATNITFTKISGSQVVLNWPAGQGWKLQTQTNALSVGLKTNWVEVVGATPPYTNTVSPATAATFFRLVYP
jgi:fibronectin-binding autotransporter adhesin